MIRLEDIPNKLPGEHVVIFLRRHWIDLFQVFSFALGMLIVPVALGIFLNSIGLTEHVFWGPALLLAASGYVLIVFTITITEFSDYWLDTWVVTNERIINSEQHGLFNRITSELFLDQIQDITAETKGFLETFLTYGDVMIQTAAEKVRFHFINVDNPEIVKQTIQKLSKDCKTHHSHKHPEQEPEEPKTTT